MQWKREEAYNCIRAKAHKEALLEMDKQIEYKKAKAADRDKIIARELAITAQIEAELEEERLKRELCI